MATRIYYLDDELHLCEIFKEFMGYAGYEVETFTSSNAAIAACEANPPDLIFIDYRLADANGCEVAERIASDITKVLVTGELNMPTGKVFDYQVAKPYKLDEVRSLIQGHLAR